MAKTIKYIGTQNPWPELSVTGKQSVWHSGQQEERQDVEADLLMGSGFFSLVSSVARLTAPVGVPKQRSVIMSRDGNNIRLSKDGKSLGILGDSRYDNAFFFDAFPQTGSPGGAANSYRGIKWHLGLGGQPFSRSIDVSRAGSGCTSAVDTIHPTYQEQLASILVAMPSHCMVLTPINDLLNGRTAVETWAAFKPIVDQLIAAGIAVELETCNLLDSSKASYSGAVQDEILALNALVRANYGANGADGVYLHDTASAATVASDKTLAGIAGAYQDYVHDYNIGAFLRGSIVGANWLSRFKPMPILGTHCGDAYRDVAADNSSVGAILRAGSNNFLSNGMFDLGTPAALSGSGSGVIA